MTVSHFDSVQSFGQRTDLVYFDQDRVCTSLLDTHCEEVNVRNEQVITYQLAAVADTFSQFLPAFPVVFAHTVFDGVDWEFVDQFFQVVDLFFGGTFLAFGTFKLGIVVDTVMVEFGRSAVHTDHYVFTWFVSGSFDGCDDRVQSIFRTFEVRSETTFVAYGSAEATILQYFLQSVEYFGAHSQTFSE